MFVRQPQFRNSNADVQFFFGGNATSNTTQNQRVWNKPPGVSHVYMMAIGAGGNGDGVNGGGSASVSVWYGAAQTVPDSLVITLGVGGSTNTTIYFRASDGTYQTLLTGSTPAFSSGASAPTANAFGNSGFFQSTAGTSGGSGAIGPASLTFLSAGTDGGSIITGNYGYTTNNQGYFLFQPIIVGLGANNGASGTRRPGYGCGGDANGNSPGGPGMVLIASW